MKRYQKILLGIFITILIILGGCQIYFSFFLDEQLKETAVNRFHKATGDAYDLKIGKFDLWVLGRKLNVSDIQLTTRENDTVTEIRATVDSFTLSGISFWKFLFNRNLNLSQVELLNPKIEVTSPGNGKEHIKKTDWTSMSRKLSETTLQGLNDISISEISIRGLSLDYNRADLSINPLLSFKNSTIRLYDIEIDSTSLKHNRILPSGNIAANFQDIHYQTSSGLYNLAADQIKFSSVNGTIEIDSIQLDPKFDRQKFARQVDHEIDRISLILDNMSWEGIDAEQLNRGEGISSRNITLENADIDIYRDKRPPFPPNNRPLLPHDMLRNIPFPISVDSVSLINSNIRYSERVPKANEAGFVEFADLSATFRNLSNNENRWKQSDNPTLHAETNVMDKARLKTDFSFVVTDSGDQQQIKGTLQSMHMQPLNEALVPLAFVRINDGKILGMDFEMTLGKEQARGKVMLRYEDLKISLLDKETNKETFGNKVTSLMANTFKIKSENKGDDPRIGKVSFERVKNKSAFNYWWKSLLSGLKSSIGL